MALIEKLPESWSDCDMNWDDPDPLNPVYYIALARAFEERFIALSSKDYFVNFFQWYLSPTYKMLRECAVMNASQMNTSIEGLYQCADYLYRLSPLDRDSFFRDRQVKSMPNKGLYDVYPRLYMRSIEISAMKDVLIFLRDHINKFTLFSGENPYYGLLGFSGTHVAGGDEPQSGSVYPGTPPPYDFLKFEDLYRECYAKGNQAYIDDKTATYNSAKELYGTCDMSYKYYDVEFTYYLRRENNFPYAHTSMSWSREGIIIFARKNAPYQPTVHCIVESKDGSYNRVLESGVTQIEVDSVGGVAKSMSDSPQLLKDYIVGLSGIHIIESNPPESYPIKDVDIPLAGSDGWQTYTCGGKDTVQFALDFNYEGGFKFRPDDDSSKSK